MKKIRKIAMMSAMLAACLWVSGVPSLSSAQEYGDDEPLPVVAVMDIVQDGAGLNQASLKRMSEYLLSRITAGGAYSVVPRDQVAQALVKQKVKAQEPCYGSCQISLAGAVAASKVLQAKFMKIGSRCSLILDLYDVQTETMEKSVEVDKLACTESGLKDGVLTGARNLNGKIPDIVPPPLRDEEKTELPPPPEVTEGGPVPDDNPPPPAVKAEIGSLYVNGEPKGARVDIAGPKGFGDNGKVATSLPVAPFEVPAGLYTIKVSQPGYDPEETQVRIFSDATDGVKVSLVQSNGQVQISGKPEGAKSRLECEKGFAKEFGLPPSSSPWTVTVPRGECRLTVERDGYTGYDETFTVTGGGTTRQAVELARDTSGGVAGSGGVRWVRIPGGTFQMGSSDGESDEKPVRGVTVSTFEIAATEVTVAQYKKCVEDGTCSLPHWDDGTCWVWDGSQWKQGKLPQSYRGDQQPVVCVDWNQATTYAKWVGGRLPTEAEWEYAARSGGRNQKYPWGDQTATCSYAVMSEGGNGCGRDSTWPVCSKTAGNTAQGLCDMAGNVWEWVSDWYGSYGSGSVTNPTGSSAGSGRVYRGGSFNFDARLVRAAYRNAIDPGYRFDSLGFRPARSVR